MNPDFEKDDDLTEETYTEEQVYDDAPEQPDDMDRQSYMQDLPDTERELHIIRERLDAFEQQLQEKRTFPLMNQAMFNRNELLVWVQTLRENMPTAIKQAILIRNEQEKRIEEARDIADNTVAQAQGVAKKTQMAAHQQAEKIQHDAKTRANAMMADAQRQGNEIYESAQHQAQEIVKRAEEERRRLIDESEIAKAARAESKQLVDETRSRMNQELRDARARCVEYLSQAENAALASANALRDLRMDVDPNG